MDYVKPAEVVAAMVEVGATKATLPACDIIIRGMLAGGLLGICTTLAATTTVQTGLPLAGALIFPIGFAVAILLGFELLTGSFALIPVAQMAGRCSWSNALRYWAWAFLGNLLGTQLYALLFWAAQTDCGSVAATTGVAARIVTLAESKTLVYASLGTAGLATAFIKGILCNWMVCMGVVMGQVSRSTLGKLVAAWLPVTVFYAQGFEHAVVNMFVIPAGMLFGAKVGLSGWLFWNLLPVLLGNFVGGFALTGGALYLTYGKKQAGAATAAPAAAITEAL